MYTLWRAINISYQDTIVQSMMTPDPDHPPPPRRASSSSSTTSPGRRASSAFDVLSSTKTKTRARRRGGRKISPILLGGIFVVLILAAFGLYLETDVARALSSALPLVVARHGSSSNRTDTDYSVIEEQEDQQPAQEQPQKSPPSRRKAYAVVKFRGERLGNEMFKWASTLGVAHSNNMVACVQDNATKPIHMAKAFVGPFPTCTDPIHFSNTAKFRLGERYRWGHGLITSSSNTYTTTSATISDEEYDGGDVLIDAFPSSFKYFDDEEAIEQVRRAFALQEDVQKQVDEFLQPIHAQGKQPVGLHIRRQDYAREWGGAGRPTNIPDPSFFTNAMAYIRVKHGADNLIFVVATDDVPWCKQQPFLQGDDVVFAEKDTYLDLSVLAACRHNIVTLGTYGWWGAWLGPGSDSTNRTIVYFGNEHRLDHPRVKKRLQEGTLPIKGDRYPAGWVPIM